MIHTVYTVEEEGKKQYHTFVDERLTAIHNKPLSDTISKNKLPWFNICSAKCPSKTKQQITDLKTDCALFGQMYIGSLARQGDLHNFFKHENHKCPPSLSDMGQLRQGAKSDLLECIEACSSPSQDIPIVDAMILDGAAIVHLLKP